MRLRRAARWGATNRGRPASPSAKPFASPQAEKCPAGDARCEGRPEMLSCAGTGFARCTFLWRQGKQIVEIGTVGDEDVRVERVRCRSGCR